MSATRLASPSAQPRRLPRHASPRARQFTLNVTLLALLAAFTPLRASMRKHRPP